MCVRDGGCRNLVENKARLFLDDKTNGWSDNGRIVVVRTWDVFTGENRNELTAGNDGP